jgi:hypothetical protein
MAVSAALAAAPTIFNVVDCDSEVSSSLCILFPAKPILLLVDAVIVESLAQLIVGAESIRDNGGVGLCDHIQQRDQILSPPTADCGHEQLGVASVDGSKHPHTLLLIPITELTNGLLVGVDLVQLIDLDHSIFSEERSGVEWMSVQPVPHPIGQLNPVMVNRLGGDTSTVSHIVHTVVQSHVSH